MNPPGQLITEALHIFTLLINIYIEGRGTPWSIDHRCLAYRYTAYIYKGDEPPWSIEHRGLAYCYTAYIYIEGK